MSNRVEDPKNKEKLQKVVEPCAQLVMVRNGESGVEFYLGHRIAGAFSGQWSFPGGRLEGDSAAQAACREAKEEAGVDVSSDQIELFRHTFASTVREKDGVRYLYEYPFDVFVTNAQDLSPTNTSPDEHDDMRWMTLAKAIEIHNQAVREAMDKGSLPEIIPNAIAPRTLETMRMLSAAA